MTGKSLRAQDPAGKTEREQRHAWRVLHACDQVRAVLPLVESQLSVGMKPTVATLEGAQDAEAFVSEGGAAQPASLLSAWGEVRQWRRSMVEAQQSTTHAFELLHAHSFASGMAAVRNFNAVVYSIRNFVEQQAGEHREEPSWLQRSFRVAEQFVISRAAALVVHRRARLAGALERGAAKEHTFYVPDPLPGELLEQLQTRRVPARAVHNATVNVMARGMDANAAASEKLLASLALLRKEGLRINLYIPVTTGTAEPMLTRARTWNVAECLHAIRQSETERLLEKCEIVICEDCDCGEGEEAPLACRALLAGCALLLPQHGEQAGEVGRGLVWFRAEDEKDLARRIALLAANPDLRQSLAQSARRWLAESRTAEAIGQQYHRVYDHAHRRRMNGPATGGLKQLQPVQAAS